MIGYRINQQGDIVIFGTGNAVEITVPSRKRLLVGLIGAIIVCGFNVPWAQDYSEDAALGGGVVELGRDVDRLKRAIRPWQNRHPQLSEKLDRALDGMASGQFQTREKATGELLELMAKARPELLQTLGARKKALGDPEVLNRLHWIEKQETGDSLVTLRGVLEWVRVQRLTTMLPAFERVLPFNLDAGLEQQLVATTRELTELQRPGIEAGHVALLRRWRSHERAAFRLAAVVSLRGAEDLLPLLDDPNQGVALEAAIGSVRAGSRQGLERLRDLAVAEDAFVERRALWALRVRKTDPTLALPHGVVSGAAPSDGRGLVLAGGHVSEVRRIDPAGELIDKWAFPRLDFIGDVIPMADGNYVIAAREDWRRAVVMGIDDKGKTTWRVRNREYECPNLLSNGHLLLASDRMVRELDTRRKEVWSVPLPGGDGRMAWRMPTGTTLVAMDHRVQEFDWDRRLVWEMDFTDDYVVSCQGLPNGNRLLILEKSNRVIEVNENHDVVWEWKAPENVNVWDGFRMSNGNLLAKTESGAIEVSYGKQVLWKMDFGQAGHVRRL